jgi:hypothetical protein
MQRIGTYLNSMENGAVCGLNKQATREKGAISCINSNHLPLNEASIMPLMRQLMAPVMPRFFKRSS